MRALKNVPRGMLEGCEYIAEPCFAAGGAAADDSARLGSRSGERDGESGGIIRSGGVPVHSRGWP